MSEQQDEERDGLGFAAVVLGSETLCPSDYALRDIGREVAAASEALLPLIVERTELEVVARALGMLLRDQQDEREARPDDVASGWGA